jgi:hypothetical protein
MKSYQLNDDENKNQLQEGQAPYGLSDKDEERLQEALKRTDTEKFYFLMSLMKMGATMKKAIIHHKK